jgi:hypothetical protein
MPETSETKPSFFRSLGELFGILARDLGRALAVLGGLWTGFHCASKASDANANDWLLFSVAGAIFVSLAFVCRK